MKQFTPMAALLSILIGFVALAHAENDGAGVPATPLSKVLEMLDGMLGTCKEGKHAEETEFAAYQQWCDSTRGNYGKSIAEAASSIEQLQADIAKASSDAEQYGATADDHLGIADGAEKELKNATALRKKQHADYTVTHADFSEAIGSIERAKATLLTRKADVPQSLVQVRHASARLLAHGADTQQATSSIDALLALGGAPDANAYEFQSSSVVDLLEKMRLKFQDERLALEKSEQGNKQNHEVLSQRLRATIEESKSVAAAKTAAKAQSREEASKAKGDLEITEVGKAEDEKAHEDLNTECSEKSGEFEKNQVVRANEIKALEEATDIMRSDSVSGTAETYLPTAFIQRSSGLALAQRPRGLEQLRGTESETLRARVADLLQERAARLGSRYLSLAAGRAAADPFAKVKQMIGDMIVKLMEEANSEADHKAFCDAELAANKQTRDTKQAEVEELSAGVEKNTADSEQLVEELAELNDAVKELKERITEATALRTAEKDTNAKTVADAKASQVAVGRAIEVLKEFYGKTSDDSSFLQSDGGLGQAMAQAASVKAPYTGMQSESGGILGFLDVIMSDFSRLEADTSSAEDLAQAEHEKFMDESQEYLAVKATEIGHKEDGKRAADETVARLTKELELTQEELDAALTYFDKLKPDCVHKGLSYEERVAKREQEVQSLQEALNML